MPILRRVSAGKAVDQKSNPFVDCAVWIHNSETTSDVFFSSLLHNLWYMDNILEYKSGICYKNEGLFISQKSDSW